MEPVSDGWLADLPGKNLTWTSGVKNTTDNTRQGTDQSIVIDILELWTMTQNLGYPYTVIPPFRYQFCHMCKAQLTRKVRQRYVHWKHSQTLYALNEEEVGKRLRHILPENIPSRRYKRYKA